MDISISEQELDIIGDALEAQLNNLEEWLRDDLVEDRPFFEKERDTVINLLDRL